MKSGINALISAGLVVFPLLILPAVLAADPEGPQARYEQMPDSYSFPLASLTITSLSDGTVPQDLHQLLTGISVAENDRHLHNAFLANPVEASINVFLVRGNGRTILIDTGAGELFGPGNGGKLPDSLASIGVSMDDVTDILITHIHTDHTGGLIRNGMPAFANATIHVAADDLSFFLDWANSAKTGYADRYFQEALGTIGQYHQLGRVKSFKDGATVLPGITASLHPGHTPGSAFFTVESPEQSITFIGDIIHVGAVQFSAPDVTIVYDLNPADAATARKLAFDRLSRDRSLVAAPHLPYPGVGYIGQAGDNSFSWHPLEYRNRASHYIRRSPPAVLPDRPLPRQSAG